MQLYAPSGTRSTALDRSPSTIAVGGAASATAGQDNQVATYTVPASRRFDGRVQAGGVVTTALVAGQAANNKLLVTPSGGGANALYEAELQPLAAVGARGDTPSVHVQLKAGDQVQIRVTAGAGAGQFAVRGGIHGVEYDA